MIFAQIAQMRPNPYAPDRFPGCAKVDVFF
jgi:hypothetical protein